MVDYESLIIPAFIGAIFGILVNIIYYEYQFSKEKKAEFLKMQITELLLPLYLFFYNIEKELSIRDPSGEDTSELIKYLSNEIDLKNIPTNKLYLANPKLSDLLLDFLHYQYVLARRETSYLWVTDEGVRENYDKLWQEIRVEYKQKVEEYQRKFEGKEWLFWK